MFGLICRVRATFILGESCSYLFCNDFKGCACYKLGYNVMKKISLSIFCVLVANVIFAQGSTEFGVKAGLNLANMHEFSKNMRPGIHAGVFAEYTFNDFIGIQGELLYSMMGTRDNNFLFLANPYYSYSSSVVKAKATYKYNYIVLPVLAKLYVAKGLSLDLGPQFGYLISAKTEENIDGRLSTWNDYDYIDNKFDVAFAMGFSYKLSNRFDVSGRYNLGFTKLDKGYDDYNSKTNVIQFGIGYRFK